MPTMVTLAALFAAAATYAAYRCFAALRWREVKRFWLFLGATFPLFILAVALLWIGIEHPRLNDPFPANLGFGPEWDCTLNASGAQVCLRYPQTPASALQPKAEQKTP
jgi:hypothetical protein